MYRYREKTQSDEPAPEGEWTHSGQLYKSAILDVVDHGPGQRVLTVKSRMLPFLGFPRREVQ